MSCLSPFYRSALGVGYMHRISYYLARWLGAVLGCFFFGGMCNIFTLPFFFVPGVAHNTHTHIHINRTLANFFPDTLLTSGGFHPKPIYETNFAIFFGVFHFRFCSRYPSFSKKIFSNILAAPPHDPKTPSNLGAELPKIVIRYNFI